MLKIVFGIVVALCLGFALIHFLNGFEGVMVGKEDAKSHPAQPVSTHSDMPSISY